MREHLPPIVVVHGVGSPAPGITIGELAKAILHDRPGSHTSETAQRVQAGFTIPTLQLASENAQVTLYEVNWSDVARPRQGFIGVLAHFIRVQFAMTRLAQEGWASESGSVSRPSLIGSAFRIVMIAAAFWAPVIPVSVFFAATVMQTWLAVLILGFIALMTSVVTHALARYDGFAKAGYAWAVLALMSGGATILCDSPAELFKISGMVAGGAETICSVLVLAGIAETFSRYVFHWRAWRTALRPALVRCAMYILPFSFLVGGIGSILIGGGLFISEYGIRFRLVNAAFHDGLLGEIVRNYHYNVAFMEVVNATTTFVAIAYFIVAVGLWALLLTSGLVAGSRWGDVFRWIVAVWLVLMLALTAVVVAALAIDLLDVSPYVEAFRLDTIEPVRWIVTALTPGAAGNSRVSYEPMEVYKYSALRLAPAILWLVPKLREAISLVTDVLFHQLPKDSDLCTAKKTVARFQDCFEFAANQTDMTPVVLAHSQGSRIAVDALREMYQRPPWMNGRRVRLITIGSPLDALYRKFLGSPSAKEMTDLASRTRWTNLYRDSDYIGGPINVRGVEGVTDRRIAENFELAHGGYFVEPDVIDAVRPPVARLDAQIHG